jgi:hypothetical protein
MVPVPEACGGSERRGRRGLMGDNANNACEEASCLAVASANPSANPSGTFSTTSPPATTAAAAVTGAATLLSSDANFFYFCDP